MSDASILFEEVALPGGRQLGVATLNVPDTLNSLSLEMIDLLHPRLAAWEADPALAAVLVKGAGGRAFCAGGDIQALYHAIRENQAAGETVNTYPFDFFEREYRLDYLLHTFAKPIVVLGHGAVMGGGLGIFTAASHRVLTERSRVAIPEITIGLFPDAGTTWLLKNLPLHLAVFTGMTGSHLGAADALYCGAGTHAVASDQLADLESALGACALTGDRTQDDALLSDAIGSVAEAALPEPELERVPQTLHVDGALTQTVAELQALAGTSEWVDRCLAGLAAGCPTSIGVVQEQIRRTRQPLTLADAFRLEMTVATHCALNTDFAEGVRALLIDKDNAPAWRFGDVANLPDEHVQSHFEEPWERNPLADLEQDR